MALIYKTSLMIQCININPISSLHRWCCHIYWEIMSIFLKIWLKISLTQIISLSFMTLRITNPYPNKNHNNNRTSTVCFPVVPVTTKRYLRLLYQLVRLTYSVVQRLYCSQNHCNCHISRINSVLLYIKICHVTEDINYIHNQVQIYCQSPSQDFSLKMCLTRVVLWKIVVSVK